MPLGQPEIRRFASQRLSLAYADWGNHDAPLLALVHGGRDHKRSWDWTADALKDEFHVVAPDLRGHGESDWASDGDYSMADYVLDLAALFKHLGKQPQTIVAHSLGGMVALRYAGLYPERVRRIVAVEGLGMSPRMIAEQEAKPVSERLRAWVDKRLANTERPLKRYPDIAAATARMR
ncbi:MAG: alpha/beta hydrolase, partial [Amphiplicatus sp.]